MRPLGHEAQCRVCPLPAGVVSDRHPNLVHALPGRRYLLFRVRTAEDHDAVDKKSDQLLPREDGIPGYRFLGSIIRHREDRRLNLSSTARKSSMNRLVLVRLMRIANS
jgi:hypothetical protein